MIGLPDLGCEFVKVLLHMFAAIPDFDEAMQKAQYDGNAWEEAQPSVLGGSPPSVIDSFGFVVWVNVLRFEVPVAFFQAVCSGV
ncbi:MAG: hypothetical protein MAG451_02853 [Anaerolineales bacterium]|nr:hypothetical protein [Anaerolineales bacterium]